MPNNNSPAGDLPVDDDLKGLLTIKKGIRTDNPRGGERKTCTFKVNEGFLILKAKLQTLASPLPEDSPIYFKRSKNATQAQFVVLTSENYEDHVKARWRRITQLDIARWQNNNTTAVEGTDFEFFVYKPRSARRTNTGGMRRATARAIEQERRLIQEHAAATGRHIGEIQLQHLAVHNARHRQHPPEGAAAGNPNILDPNDATNNQARSLDEAQAQLDQENAQAEQHRNNVMRPVIMKLNGTNVTVEVSVASLRAALGLPQHDLFHEGLYRGYVHPELPEGDDMEDVDHQ